MRRSQGGRQSRRRGYLGHLLLSLTPCAHAWSEQLFHPPEDAAAQPAWLAALHTWRDATRQSINFTGRLYDDPSVNWTRLSYVQPQVHPYDRYLYDHVARNFTVGRFLADLSSRYGGIDSVLLWPTYTNLGIDARNQFDYFRALPGGLEGLKDLTAQFKARGVRVLWAYNPWDQGTRSEAVKPWETLAQLLQETGGDGFNGDTMPTMYKEFWDAGLSAGYPVVGEMEGGGYPVVGKGREPDCSWQSANWDPMGWGENFHEGNLNPDNISYRFAAAPGVDRLKWLDGRHMTHVVDRWAKNRTDGLQYAFFNGNGYESWENVWGIFMKFTPRDGEALRRIATLLRWLGREEFIQGYNDWEPYTPDVRIGPQRPYAQGGVVGSRFRHASGDCAWLVVNRDQGENDSRAGFVNVSSCRAGRIFDLYRGVELRAGPLGASVQVEPGGYAAILATSRTLTTLQALLEQMGNLTVLPLASYSSEWVPLRQEMLPMATRSSYVTAPPGMALVPRTRYGFRTAGTEIEGGCNLTEDTFGVCCDADISCPGDERCSEPCAFPGNDSRGVDVQFPWETRPGRFHDELLELGPFFIDRHLVTKGNFSAFLADSGYSPRDPYNFLRGWEPAAQGRWLPAGGESMQPVVWVSLDEARAYCDWAGKRLPHVYEWQLAAQGADGRLYPWGNEPPGEGSIERMPAASNASEVPPLPNVGSFSPAGDSPYGVADLVGHVWQFTDEFQDEHTRAVLLKGSSLYTPMLSKDFPAVAQVGNWYFPKAPEVNRHSRMMLMDESYERAGTLGFRCAADHTEGPQGPHHLWRWGHASADMSERHVHL